METCSSFVLDLYAWRVYIVAFAGSGAPMSSLQAARQERAAGVGSRTVHASMNCAVGVCRAGAGYFLWWTLRLAGSSALFHSSNYGEVRRPPRSFARGPKAVSITAGENSLEQRTITA